MKVRINDRWIDALDYDAENKAVICVTKWLCLAPVPRAHFSYPFSPKILWHYRSIGAKSIARKIISRYRNDGIAKRYISVGKGIVERAVGNFNVGDSVVFVASNHPEGLTRVVLDERWVCLSEKRESGDTQWSKIKGNYPLFLDDIAGFELESGHQQEEVSFSEIEDLISAATFFDVVSDASPFATSRIAKDSRLRKKISKVTIFGWGHHARTQIAPNLPEGYLLSRIHDIDPLVLTLANENITTDSTRGISKDDDSAVVIAAGYHHTHSDLVLNALGLGKTVICEKPLATSWDQFEELEKLKAPKLIMAYHRRYDAFFENIRESLSTESSKINYRCVVHEVSLPENHWYNWPVSKSKIVSNGCHWIDHFLALKPGLEVVEFGAFRNEQGINCNLRLEDGSTFTMLLSDQGSDAKGNREEIHIDAGARSVFIKDFESWVFSTEGKQVASLTAKKLEVFPKMYDTIFGKIMMQDFDDFSEVLRTQRTLLKLDDELGDPK